jgi:Spy/CpxP family protein refolding chaperone
MKRTLLVLAAMLCATAAYAQGPRPGPGGPGGPPPAPSIMMALMPPPVAAIDGLTKFLSLTTDQATALKAVLTTSDATIQPLVKAAADASKALRAAVIVPADEFDADNVVNNLLPAAQNAEGAVATAELGVWVEMGKILTKDQLTKLQADRGPGCPPPPPGGRGR